MELAERIEKLTALEAALQETINFWLRHKDWQRVRDAKASLKECKFRLNYLRRK